MCIPNLGTDSDSLFGTPCKTGLSPEITFIEAAQSQSLGCLHPRYCGLSSVSFCGHVPWLENKYIKILHQGTFVCVLTTDEKFQHFRYCLEYLQFDVFC